MTNLTKNVEVRIKFNEFVFRDYQKPIIRAIENDHIRKALIILPRRAGKDLTCIQLALRQCLTKTCTVFYVFPSYGNARKSLWDAITIEGKKILDYFPDVLCKKNATEMKITFLNGSIIQFLGSSEYDRFRGSNPYMVIFSEYAYQNPMAYSTIRPILAANDGIAVFVSCVSPNTIVITQDGLKRIKDISSSRTEYTDLNKGIYGLNGFHNATNFYYGGKQDTLKIKLRSGFEIECTKVHKLWNGAEWVKSVDLRVGGCLPIQYGQNVFGLGLDFSEFKHKEHPNSGWQIEDRIEDKDFFYLLGLIHADGSFGKNKVTVTKKRDPEIIEFLLNNRFITFKDGIHHNFNSRTFILFLEFIGFKHGARNKTFPSKLFECSREQLICFLQGLFDGDGCSNKSNGNIHFASACFEFTRDLQVILLNFGIVSSIRKHNQKPTDLVKVSSVIYLLEVAGYFAHVFYDSIGFRLKRKQFNRCKLSARNKEESGNVCPVDVSKLKHKLPKNIVTNPKMLTRRMIKRMAERYDDPYLVSLLDEQFYYSKIVLIEESSSEVFDFVIPDTHSFFSNGFISHNTPFGKNHFWDLYQLASNSPDWLCYRKTVDETMHITQEALDVERSEMSHDMFMQEYYCFPGEQQVLTSVGLRNIEDIKLNELVFSHSGRLRKVTKLFKRHYEGNLISIRSFGTYEHIRCTPNHPIRIYHQKTQKYSWKNAGEITIKDRIIFPKKKLSNVNVISYELCMLLAWYISDGSSFKNGIQFTINKEKSKRIVELLTKLNIEFKVYDTRVYDTCVYDKDCVNNIVINSVFYVDFFRDNCGVICYEKRIPFSLIIGHEKDFFYELMKGDGCFSVHNGHEKYSFSTTSKTLAYQIQFLANSLNLDYASGITRRKGGPVKFPHGRICETRESYAVQVFIPKAKLMFSSLHRTKYGIAAKLKSVETESYCGDVYNLSVQYDESYIVGGRAVHNCSFDQGVAGSVYAKIMNELSNNNQLTSVPWERSFPVHTAWDIGYADNTVIIFFQKIGQTVHIIDYYSNNQQGLEHYIKYLDTKPYKYGLHIAPHDMANHSFSTGNTRMEMASRLGVKFTIAAKLSISDGIEAAKVALSKCYIDNIKCDKLIKDFNLYRYEWDDRRQQYKNIFVHGPESHSMDAFRYLATMLSKVGPGSSPEELNKRYQQAIYKNNVNWPSPF